MQGFDKNTGRGMSAEEADFQIQFAGEKNFKQLLELLTYLNSIAFNFEVDHTPEMDKTIFRAISRRETDG